MKIWIYADDTYRETNVSSLIDMDDLPVKTENGWKFYEILGLEPFPVDLDEPIETSSGGIIRPQRSIWHFNCVFMPEYGLSNLTNYYVLVNQLRKPFKYFVLEDYNTNAESHFIANGYAVEFEVIGKIESPEAEYEKAKKSLTFELRKVKVNA